MGWPRDARAQGTAVSAPVAALIPNPAFAHFPGYAGTLGQRPIVLRLGPQAGDSSGVHGEYQYTDTGEVVLIAGDRVGDTLEAEDSTDGTNIVGNWVGRFAADGSLAGDRMNPDDSDPQPFDLHPLAASAAGASSPAAPAAPKQAPVATPPAPPSQAVNGVSNLSVDD